MSEEDLEFQNTKRSPDQDDMVVELFVEAEKAIGISLIEGTGFTSLGQMLFLSAVIAIAGFTFGFIRNKNAAEAYVPLIEMKSNNMNYQE
jgi:hypothetical protein